MWLDRFGGPHPANTPPPPSQSRTQSPLPRRTSSARGPYLTSQRPGLSPRVSSLSIASADSSSSLLGAPKRANGSTLKQTTSVDFGPDPAVILTKILGPLPDQATLEGGDRIKNIPENGLNLDFDFNGLSLRELADGDACGAAAGDAYRPQTVEDCRSSRVCLAVPHILIDLIHNS